MTVYRIVKKKRLNTILSGYGASLSGGRWNSEGTEVVYTSKSVSLAIMENFVHLGVLVNNKLQYSIATINIPDNLIDVLKVEQLPSDWKTNPPPESTAQIGDAWIQNNSSLALVVPSVVVPIEENVLINPLHKDFSKISIIEINDYYYDDRMWKN
jgi:RES domain-containing protein